MWLTPKNQVYEVNINTKNKMENTIQNKKMFYAQYWNQSVLMGLCSDGITPLKTAVSEHTIDYWENTHLELTPLSMISDEDAIEVAKMCSLPLDDTYKPFFEMLLIQKEFCNYLFMARPMSIYEAENIISFLRSKGYAVPFMGLSAEQIINFGWITLKK